MLSVIIAAGALFTAVYDVLYKYNTTNTTILNAATVDKTGETLWYLGGSERNCNETQALTFDQGTYMIFFNGQDANNGLDSHGGENLGYGAVCLAFYKGNSMTVQIGVGGGIATIRGAGYTSVTTNFAHPAEYNGTLIAIASGAGARSNRTADTTWTIENIYKVQDGTFAGWKGETRAEVKANMGLPDFYGCPATQYAGGISHSGTRTSNAITTNENGSLGCGGGGGYYEGGSDNGTNNLAGGGSCTPWCYPLKASDVVANGLQARNPYNGNGSAGFIRIDPTSLPTGDTVESGSGATLNNTGTTGAYTPVTGLQATYKYVHSSHTWLKTYDCGIRVGWVYSCSEDGEKWGAGSDNEWSKA